jgi:hypothetical protein
MEIWWDINNRWMSRIWRRVQYCWPPKWTTLAKIYSCRCPVRISPLLVGRQKNLVHDSPPIWSSDWSKLLHNKSPILPIFPGDFPVISHPIGFPSDFPVISHPIWFSHGFFGGESSRLRGPGGALQLKKSSYATQFLGDFFRLSIWLVGLVY